VLSFRKSHTLVAAVLCIAFAGCSAGGNSALSLPKNARANQQHIPSQEQRDNRAALPMGTEIYYVASTIVTDGTRQYVFPNITLNNPIPTHVTIANKAYSFSPFGNAHIVPNAEYYRLPGTALPVALKSRMPDETIPGTQAATVATRDCTSCQETGEGVFQTDRQQGIVSSFSGDGLSFTVEFNNTLGTSVDYNYTYTLYDSNNNKVFSSGALQGSLVGPAGGMTFDTSSFAFSTVQFFMTTTSGGSADMGNAHATRVCC
jgi:hypothetical protein